MSRSSRHPSAWLRGAAVGGERLAVGVLDFLILLLVMMPVPTVVNHLLGLRGPYL